MQTAQTRSRSESALALTAATVALLMAPPARGQGCSFSEVGVSETIAIELAMGKTAMLQVHLSADALGETSCTAWITVPLSSFPTSRLAARPSDIARSMRDVVKKLGAKECAVMVEYENDTGEELAEHELCLMETFGFGRGTLWSKAREGYCWEPDSSEVEVVVVE